MKAGKRVGVTSLSHKAIHNMLRAIQHEADNQGFSFRGARRAREADEEETSPSIPSIEASKDADVCADPSYQLVAGTAWAFTRETVDIHAAERPLDVLFVDEAGQLALADVLAVGTAARSLVLLGDPNQLPQVAQGSHPEGSGPLGARAPPRRARDGAARPRALPRARRGGCGPSSARSPRRRTTRGASATRRRPRAARSRAGNGLVWLPVEHEGHGQSSPEEAEAIAALGRGAPRDAVHGRERRDPAARGARHPRRRALQRAGANRCARISPRTVAVGTVDKFQGQQAPVVFVSMASSSSEEAPRGIGFAFSSHRFNVATSRAQCRAVLVCSPALLDADCATIDQMRLVSAVSRFVELAREQPS